MENSLSSEPATQRIFRRQRAGLGPFTRACARAIACGVDCASPLTHGRAMAHRRGRPTERLIGRGTLSKAGGLTWRHAAVSREATDTLTPLIHLEASSQKLIRKWGD